MADAPTSPDLGPQSPAEPGTASSLRASDAEREQAVSELKEQFVAGRLSQDTFLHRVQSALGARQRRDLPPLLADLPAGSQRPGGLTSLKGRLRGMARLSSAVSRQLDAAARRLSAPGTGSHPHSPATLAFPPRSGTGFTIGRDSACNLLLADATVSRVHARLEWAAGGWLLTDLGSMNGTRVNGWLVRDPVRVRGGDLVRFGLTQFVLHDGHAEPVGEQA